MQTKYNFLKFILFIYVFFYIPDSIGNISIVSGYFSIASGFSRRMMKLKKILALAKYIPLLG